MRFWDTSAIVSLFALEWPSWRVWELFRDDPEIVLWWATPIECASVLARFEREDRVSPAALLHAWKTCEDIASSALEIQPLDEIRLSAKRLLSSYPLRAADSLQLAAALFWRESATDGASFVTLDNRLRMAATLEGFYVLPYAEEVHEPPEAGEATEVWNAARIGIRKTIDLDDLESSLRGLLEQVKLGEPVRIIEQEKPIARFIPIGVPSGALRPHRAESPI